jgi:ubiquinone/menaquinone biosynthesis C-methylase UbiE
VIRWSSTKSKIEKLKFEHIGREDVKGMKKSIHWSNQEHGYAEAVNDGSYHDYRLQFINKLLPKLEDIDALDFGCGEGVIARILAENGAKSIIGIDPSSQLLDQYDSGFSLAHKLDLRLGDVGSISEIPSQSLDLVVVANVLAYMSVSEEDLFYKESYRVLKPGGMLVATHSNVLFDMFTFNNLTVDFFSENFNVDVSSLIENRDLTSIETYGIRENPLSYGDKLFSYGFKELDKRFFHHHPAPPRLGGASGDTPRNRIFEDLEKAALELDHPDWKENFNSSTFGVKAEKIS